MPRDQNLLTHPAKYVHDAQCIVYRGPDKKYYGRDLCYGYNGSFLLS